MTTKYLPINRSQWWGHLNNIFFKWNDNDNKIFWAITHSDGTILELDISFHSCFSRLCVSCLPSCIQYKCPSKIQFNTDGLPSCIWYKCYGTPPCLKSAASFCSPSSSFYPFILPSCPPHPHFYHLISLHLMMRMKMTMVRGHDMIYTNLLHMRKMVIQEARMTRQSTATITDMRWRWGSPTEVDSWNRHWSDLIRFDQIWSDLIRWVMIITEVDSWNRDWSDLIRWDGWWLSELKLIQVTNHWITVDKVHWRDKWYQWYMCDASPEIIRRDSEKIWCGAMDYR